MKKQTLITLALCSCTLGLIPVSCNNGSEEATQEAAAPKDVMVFPIIQRDVTDYGEWFGYLRGERETDIHPRITGFLIAQEYKDGQHVEEGDVLFRIDPETFNAQLNQAKANLQAAEASLEAVKAQREKAELDLQRYEKLEPKAVSEKDLSDARHTLKAAQANERAAIATVDQMKATVQQAEINLDYTVIRAPYSGIVGEALASLGALVSPATKLANITDVNPIRATFSINSATLLETMKEHNEQTGLKAPIYLITDDGKEYPYPGKFMAMESKISGNGLINMEAAFPNPAHTLRAGMTVRVRIPMHTYNAMLVPENAIRTVLRNKFILIVDRNNVPHMVPITTRGTYTETIQEADGYTSTQKMVAIDNYGSTNLAEIFKGYGYDKASDVPVVTDDNLGVMVMNISSANSRLPEGAKPTAITTKPGSFKPVAAPVAAPKVDAKGSDTVPKAEPKPLPPFIVKVAPFLQQDAPEQSEWFGSLRGEEETEIRPHVSGFLQSQNFKDGSLVKKGDVLFTIDPAPYQAALDQARANLAAAEAAKDQAAAQLDMNRRNYERFAALYKAEPGAIAEKTVTDAATAVKTSGASLLKAEATVAQMKAAVHLAEINLGYTTITAPFDGRIGIRKPSVGALVSPSDKEPLVTLSSVNPMRVDFNVSSKNALSGFTRFSQNRSTGDTKKREDFDIVLENGAVYPHKGMVINSDNALSKTTGTLKVIGQVDNTEGILRSGMPVRVRAKLQGGKNAILVPARAPLNAQGNDMLVVLRADNTPDMVPITRGPIVNLEVTGPDGKARLQPMQIVDANRALMTKGMLEKTGAPSLEAMILGGAKVKSWQEMFLKQSGAKDFRELADKQAGEALPDDAPAKEGAKDWADLYLRKSGDTSYRDLVLRQAGAKDELDLIAAGQGCKSPLELMLKGMGYKNLADARVIVEGSLMAANAFKTNMDAGARVNKLTPQPFIYSTPKTVMDSITADKESNK